MHHFFPGCLALFDLGADLGGSDVFEKIYGDYGEMAVLFKEAANMAGAGVDFVKGREVVYAVLDPLVVFVNVFDT